MNLGALHRGPNVSEAGARPSAFPPSLQEMDALREPRTSEERREREARNRQFAEQEAREREAEKTRTDADWNDRQLKQQKIEESANAKAAEWCDRRDVLKAELAVAQRARGELSAAPDLSSVEAAIESAKTSMLADALGVICERAQHALDQHMKAHSRL